MIGLSRDYGTKYDWSDSGCLHKLCSWLKSQWLKWGESCVELVVCCVSHPKSGSLEDWRKRNNTKKILWKAIFYFCLEMDTFFGRRFVSHSFTLPESPLKHRFLWGCGPAPTGLKIEIQFLVKEEWFILCGGCEAVLWCWGQDTQILSEQKKKKLFPVLILLYQHSYYNEWPDRNYNVVVMVTVVVHVLAPYWKFKTEVGNIWKSS